MSYNLNDLLDYTQFGGFHLLSHNRFSIFSTSQKKVSPSKKYIFKVFSFECSSSKDQKTVLDTYYQISKKKCQYILCYNHFSYLYQSSFNPTFSMRYTSTRTLDKILKPPYKLKSWGIDIYLNCIFAVSEAMKFLHDHLICHGNLCPANIIIDEANQFYLVDFGLYPIKKLYIDDENLFNPLYKDPSMENNLPSFKTDVYSFGILICELLFSFFQSRKNDSQKNFEKFLNDTNYQKFNNFPEFFVKLIQRCLNPEKTKRPSFDQIVELFKTTKEVVLEVNIQKLYNEFINSNYLFNLASKNNTFALNKIAEMYDQGKLIEQNNEKAKEFYEKAVELNYSSAQNNYGVFLQDSSDININDMSKGAHFLKLSAEQGNIIGMANYGMILFNGDGVDRNVEKAKEYLKKSADSGYAYAQVNYAKILFKIRNYKLTPREIDESLVYLKRAIDQNYPDAFYTYSKLLMKGRIGRKKVNLAMEYLKKAADLKHMKAIVKYAKCNLDGIVVPKNEKVALKYYQKAYDNGNENVINELYNLRYTDGVFKKIQSKQQQQNDDLNQTFVPLVAVKKENNDKEEEYEDDNDDNEEEESSSNLQDQKLEKEINNSEDDKHYIIVSDGDYDYEDSNNNNNEKVQSDNEDLMINRAQNSNEMQFQLLSCKIKQENAEQQQKTSTKSHLKKNNLLKSQASKMNSNALDSPNKNMSNSIKHSQTTSPKNMNDSQQQESLTMSNKSLDIKSNRRQNQKQPDLSPQIDQISQQPKASNHLQRVNLFQPKEDHLLQESYISNILNQLQHVGILNQFQQNTILNQIQRKSSLNQFQQKSSLIQLQRNNNLNQSQRNNNLNQPQRNNNLNQPQQNDNLNQPQQNSNLNQSQRNNSLNQPQQNNNLNQSQQNSNLNQSQQNSNLNQSQQNNNLNQPQLNNSLDQPHQGNSLNQSQPNSSLDQIQQNNDLNQPQQNSSLDQHQQNYSLDKHHHNPNKDPSELNGSECDDIIDLNIPTDELVPKGDARLEKGDSDGALEYYKEAIKRGNKDLYFKCAEISKTFDDQIEFYEMAVKSQVRGSYGKWRKKIFQQISVRKDFKEYQKLASCFVKLDDYSDAAIVYQQGFDNEKFELYYNKAKENIELINDGDQQYDFAMLLTKQNEKELALLMLKKSLKNGILKSKYKIFQLEKATNKESKPQIDPSKVVRPPFLPVPNSISTTPSIPSIPSISTIPTIPSANMMLSKSSDNSPSKALSSAASSSLVPSMLNVSPQTPQSMMMMAMPPSNIPATAPTKSKRKNQANAPFYPTTPTLQNQQVMTPIASPVPTKHPKAVKPNSKTKKKKVHVPTPYTPVEIEEAVKAESLYEAGMNYHDGKNGYECDYKKAKEFFLLASQLGNANANFYIGIYLQYGYGGEKDIDKALTYYKMAADGGNISAALEYDKLSTSIEEARKKK